MTFFFRGLGRLPAWIRWPAKWLIFLAVSTVVLFPRIDRLPATIARLLDAQSLVDPRSPALDPLVAEFEATRQVGLSRARQARAIESFVYRKITYTWDWEQWGNVEYLPTVEEVIRSGQEDCDGRAILAASLLRRLGFDARLVMGNRHMWVKTELGEVMGPEPAPPAAAAATTPSGVSWFPTGSFALDLAWGVGVFPVHRELIIILAAWLLLLGRRLPWRIKLAYLLALAAGLLLVREGGREDHEHLALCVAGYGAWLVTLAVMIIHERRFDPRRRRWSAWPRWARIAPGAAAAALLLLLAGPGAPRLARNIPASWLVSEAELRGLEQMALGHAAANRRQSCPRPVLRGPALPGRADEAIVSIAAPARGSPIAACLELATQRRRELGAAMTGGSSTSGDALRALSRLCKPLHTSIQRVVRHVDSCSPYLPGRRGADLMLPLVNAMQVVALEVRDRAERGRAMSAVRLGLDAVRLAQDIGRGPGAHQDLGYFGSTMTYLVVNHGLRHVLGRHHAQLSAGQLAAIDEQLRTLERTDPPFRHTLQHSLVGPGLKRWLPGIKGHGWAPPGGFGAADRIGITPSAVGRGRREQLALQWVASLEVARAAVAACPEGRDAVGCVDALAAVHESIRRQPRERPLSWITLSGIRQRRLEQLKTRQAAAAGLLADAMWWHALRRYMIRSLRVQVSLTRWRVTRGACPTPQDLAGARAMLDPANGRPMRLTTADRERYVLRPSAAGTSPRLEYYYSYSYEMSCRDPRVEPPGRALAGTIERHLEATLARLLPAP